ncbi:hypothetical protein DYE48_10035 [Halobacillus trueperi]|uniref:Uncharacterized protein n=1 Tax=Halobacillus trueperi TaxID=156205 RepID=A0A3E0J980_9BACI|nr:hypothetical protein DYE48_10035 [Halobacillus trueperi]
MEDAPFVYVGSFIPSLEWGGWEAARLPWEKEIGEIPQDGVRGSSALPHRKASCFPATLTLNMETNPGNISKLSLTQSCHLA